MTFSPVPHRGWRICLFHDFFDVKDALHRQVQAPGGAKFVAQTLLGRIDHQAVVDIEHQLAHLGKAPQGA